jgi:hypothetical protein
MNLLNRNENFTTGLRGQVSLELVNLGAFAADDDSGSRRIDNNLQPVGGAFDVNVRNAGAGKALFQIALELEIFQQELAVLFLREPVRVPVLVIAKAEPVWMNFLTHNLLQFSSSSPELDLV